MPGKVKHVISVLRIISNLLNIFLGNQG